VFVCGHEQNLWGDGAVADHGTIVDGFLLQELEQEVRIVGP
jgi:hypothetical protein